MALFQNETRIIVPDDQEPVRLKARIRDDARAACDESKWAVCLTKLDEAKKYDPAGETTVTVRVMRWKIEQSTKVDAQTPFDEKQTRPGTKGM